MDGVYRLELAGERIGGIGFLEFRQGVVTGADQGGVRYNGEYVVDGDVIKVNLRVTVPAGLQTVCDLPPSDRAYVLTAQLTLPRDKLETVQEPDTGAGRVRFKLTWLRALPE